ncbi:hypothetical protein [Geobacter sp. SVR]|uniref:hypothetical protein n=1 Tax=Geobacter sp. SVR TaxID=2495594 RepID=UPI00143EF5CB|nr:hypothetical protein [Geobacter sp. SVR]BCS55711.1 hypothetical protein GSVR_40190 [Geobacter sp. SVR]GCF83715.1 hypothetical protein GSbR_03150 [Geobacter sp. SVR]
MEAVTIAGLAVVAVGGFYSLKDMLSDLGIRIDLARLEKSAAKCTRRSLSVPQRRIEKMAGMHV